MFSERKIYPHYSVGGCEVKMMKMPVAAYSVKLKDLEAAFFPKKEALENFACGLAPFTGHRDIFFTNSGAAAFYLILESLKEISPARNEVVLPAYTASILVMAVQKSGLKAVLSDISLEDFNINIDGIDNAVSDKTLCIVVAHMFGIPVAKISNLKNRFKDVFIVEDCAQAMGAEIDGKPVGSFGDFSFYSFNRGKNLPTYGGGAATAVSAKLTQVLKKKAESLEVNSVFSDLAIPWKMLLFSIAVNPLIYGWFYPMISLFKNNRVPADFEIKKYSLCQASAAVSLIAGFKDSIEARYDNGMAIIRGLKDLNGLAVPVIRDNIKPAFNRLPVMCKDIEKRDKVEAMLNKAGIETSNMYNKPIHHIFGLGYKKESFENAVCFARTLMTLPAHPLLDGGSIEKILGVIREVF